MIVLIQAGRDLRIAFRSRGETAHPVAFFALAVALFGLGLGTDLQALGAVAVVVVWVIALLSCMLAAENLFRRDFEDGTLEQMLLHGRPLFLAVLGKLAAHWCVSGLPLVIFAPVAGFMLQAPTAALPVLVLSLVIGTPTLTAIGAVAAALTVGLGPRRSAVGPDRAAVVCAGPRIRRERERYRRVGRKRPATVALAVGDAGGGDDACTLCGGLLAETESGVLKAWVGYSPLHTDSVRPGGSST